MEVSLTIIFVHPIFASNPLILRLSKDEPIPLSIQPRERLGTSNP